MVRVLALPSGGSCFEPRSWQLVKAMRGISGPCKIVYNQWYKNRQKSVSFSGHISGRLSVVLVRAKPHKGYVTERVRSSAAISLAPGAWKIWSLKWPAPPKRAPQRYFTFTFSFSAAFLFYLSSLFLPTIFAILDHPYVYYDYTYGEWVRAKIEGVRPLIFLVLYFMPTVQAYPIG